MLDQAHDLRRLASAAKPADGGSPRRPAALLVVAGGKGGVGTTTVAINLAAALAQAGKRTLLVDADPRGGDVALRCGVDERYTLADLWPAGEPGHEVIETAAGGVQLVAGSAVVGRRRQRLAGRRGAIARTTGPRPHGCRRGGDRRRKRSRPVGQRICQAADAIVMVTTSETAAVVSTFAAIKTWSVCRAAGDATDSAGRHCRSDCWSTGPQHRGTPRRSTTGLAGRAAGCWDSWRLPGKATCRVKKG